MGSRGRLNIFLGYAAGVGKTYAMLSALRQRQAEGVDVLVGLALTHGREETEKLLEGLPVLEQASLSYKGVALSEFDLIAALERKPDLIAVDELAHTNVQGSFHTKRYMDVEELLKAGIDVYTTLNIQHLESVRFSVEESAGISVRERVPDLILDRADEIELVDIAPEELLVRLDQGKVYVPDMAQRALEKFFRKENLQVLREISLRKVASIVETSRPSSSGERVCVAPRLLAVVGVKGSDEHVIRTAKRLSDMLKAPWHVVTVKTADAAVYSDKEKKRLDGHLRLAEELGAHVCTLPGESIRGAVCAYGRAHRISQVVLGAPASSWLQRVWRGSLVEALVEHCGFDVYVVSEQERCPTSFERFMPVGSRSVLPLLSMLGLTALVYPLVGCAELGMLYFVGSLVSALLMPPVGFYVYMAAVATVLFPDLLSLEKTATLVTGVTCVVGTLVNQLMTRYRRLTSTFVEHHKEVLSLFELSKDLTSASSEQEMLSRINQHLSSLLDAEAMLCLQQGKICWVGVDETELDETEQMAALWACEHGEVAGRGSDTLPSARALWIPLSVAQKRLGSLGVYCRDPEQVVPVETIRAFARLLALSLDRG